MRLARRFSMSSSQRCASRTERKCRLGGALSATMRDKRWRTLSAKGS
jgi:hypothetical protein